MSDVWHLMQTGRGGHDPISIKTWLGYPSLSQLRRYVSDLVSTTIYGGDRYEDSWGCYTYMGKGELTIGTGVDPERAALVKGFGNPCSEIHLDPNTTRPAARYIEDDRNWDA